LVELGELFFKKCFKGLWCVRGGWEYIWVKSMIFFILSNCVYIIVKFLYGPTPPDTPAFIYSKHSARPSLEKSL